MHLQELKTKSPADLLAYAEEVEVENASNLRKQDMMFAILKQLAENEVTIFGDGVPCYARVRTVDTEAGFVEGLGRLVRTAAASNGLCSASGGRLCPADLRCCPHGAT